MAIVYVDVVGQILHADLTPAVGTVVFQIPVELRDVVDNVVYGLSTYTETLDVNGEFLFAGLPSTDSPDVTPLDWMYRVHVSTDVWAESFSTSLPGAFAPVAEFADLIPAQSEPCTPDGTPCATVAQIADLQQQINDIEGGDVQSVNGQTGVVVLDAGDVGADVAGAAAAALIAANAYTDAEIAGLPADAVTSVNGQVGVVVLTAVSVGADPAGSAAAAQAAAIAAANAYTDAEIAALPADAVTSVNGQVGVVVLDAGDVGADVAGAAAAALVAANAYTDAEIAALPADAVTSVNGQVGVVVLDAGDVGADVAGAAAAAQAAAIASSLQKAANLSDVANVATSRGNLGLGGAAVLNVGVVAGTVAAGDDARFPASAPLLAANNLSDLVNAATARTNLGLGNVDNTSDLNKPISTATQTALDLKADESITITGSNGITGGGDLTANRVLAPTYGVLVNTFAQGNDARFPASTPLLAANNLSDLANAATARTNLGLGNVDNTSDLNKPVSTATQTALDLKADESITLTAGIAMSGGGDLTANRTFDVDLGITATTVAEGRAPWFATAPMPISGRYVYTTYGATGTVVPGLDSARYSPLPVWDGFTATSISVEVTTLQATSVVRLGLYADDGTGLPGALITDFGTVSAASTGVKTISPGGGIAFSDRTLYWLCAVVQTAGGTAALRTSNYHDTLILPSSTGVTNSTINAYVQAGVSGALGSPAVPADASGGPRFMLLIA